MLGHRRADPDAGVVDEHVEAAEALAVARRRRSGSPPRRPCWPATSSTSKPSSRSSCAAAAELLGPAGGDGQPVALLAEHVRDRQPDAARGAGDEGCAVGHARARYTLKGNEDSFHRRARPARDPARRGLRVRRRTTSPRRRKPRQAAAGDADRHDRAPRGADPRPALRDAAAPADGQPGAGQARRPRGPRPQLPRRRAATPTRRCSSCSGCSSPTSTCARSRRTIFGQGVAGYYDPRTKRLRVVSGAQTTNRFLYEITLAHELTHALEDQRFGLDLEDASSSDDAALAQPRAGRGQRRPR